MVMLGCLNLFLLLLNEALTCPAGRSAAEERLAFIHLLQGFAEGHGCRVTVLSGDAHVGGVGRLYSRPKVKDLT